ncbi:MAG TPA: ACT domain-containing protein [Blastocatellia bacterium]|nr:ACT domain-containing protein [Blastocatellia bacterium]
MPRIKELNFQLDDRPGVFGKVCQSLADRGVNILAFQANALEGKSLVRLVVDNPAAAKTTIGGLGMKCNEADVAQVSLPNRPGELARAASQLGNADINIEHGYTGVDPTGKATFFFGVKDVDRAVEILDRAAASTARG